MPGTKRVINIGTNPDDGTGDLLRDALEKVNLNFDDVWSYTSVNSNLDITGDSINGTTDVIINPADTGAFKVTGDTIINPDGGNYNFTINGDLHNNVLYVQASTGRIGVHNTSPTVTLDITGDTKVSGMTTANNLTVTGNTILGDANTDTVTYNAKAASNFLPYSTTQNIGAPSNRWGYIYTTNLDVTGTIAGTFTGSMTSTLTGDVNNTNVTTVNANVTGPSNLTDVNISGNLVVQGSTTTLETTQVLVDNSIVFEGATDDAFETTLAITDPTADRTFTFPDASGTVATQEWANAQSFGGGSGPADTDALTEGTTNLYYTDTRADARITAAGSANWNTAYGWGDHSTAGYLTSETFTSVVQDTTPQLGGDLDPNGNNIVGTGDFEIDVSGSIYLDADGGTIFLQDGSTGFGQLLRSGSGDLTIASGSTQAVIFSGANAAFQGDVSVAGDLTVTGSMPAQTFASLTGKPTTIAGYGITDAFDGDYNNLSNKPTIPSAYTNSDVDTHLNQSNPTSGYVLSWNGSDYAWVANGSGSGIANVVEDTTPQLGGNLDAQAFNITTTGKILYSNIYSQTTDLPSASTYHGMFAHVHATGKGYFAHGGNWIELANNSQLANSANWDTAYGWGDHSTAGYLTAETNDLSSAVTWANVPDAYITSTSVTQHEGDLTITESQISDLQSYLTSVPAQSFASLTGKPTTLAGYGITDALTSGSALTGSSLEPTSTSSGDGNDLTITGGDASDLNSQGGDTIITGGSGALSSGNVSIGTTQTTAVSIGATGIGTTVGGTFTANGNATFETGTFEAFSTITGATGTVTHDCDNGHIFYHTSPSADFTANFTNLGLSTNYTTGITIVIDQGATARIPSAVQTDGTSRTIVWQGGSAPTGTNNGVDVVSFSILRTSGSYIVLGQLVDFA